MNIFSCSSNSSVHLLISSSSWQKFNWFVVAGTEDSVVVGTDDNVAVVPPVGADVLVAGTPKELLIVDVAGMEKPNAPVEIDGWVDCVVIDDWNGEAVEIGAKLACGWLVTAPNDTPVVVLPKFILKIS